jgi:tetratricopeptide (TPR) repeat protein
MYDKYISLGNVKPEYLADGYNNRGACYRRLGKTDLAFADFTKAIALNPSFAKAYTNRASVYKDRKDTASALADYNRAISSDPKYAQAYLGRGNMYLNSKSYTNAIADLSKAVELDPSNAEGFYSRGLVYNDTAAYAKAIADFDEYIALEPANVEYQSDGYLYRGFARQQMGQLAVALRDMTKSIDLTPDRAQGYRMRAKLYRAMKQMDLAAADEAKAATLK